MSEIDQITINFGESNLMLLNFCLGFLTFGVALDIRLSDFKQIFQQPKKIIVGLTSQWILLPAFTIALIYFTNPFPSIALGLALIAACPGGNVSNYASHLAKGNTALSVTLTSIVTVMAIFSTPIIFKIVATVFPPTAELLKQIALDKKEVFLTILQLILLPLATGIWLNHKNPKWANKLRKPTRIISMIIFVGLVLGALFSNLKNIIEHLHLVFFMVIFHNVFAYLIGYFIAKANGLPKADSRTISIETGVQNAGLGLVVVFSFFKGLGGMMLVAAWWGVWNLVSALVLSLWWSKR